MLRPGEEVDTAEIDAMLQRMDADGDRISDIMRAVSRVNGELKRNITALEDPSAVGDGAIRRDELLKLLKSFAKFSCAVENYLKEKTPSSLC